jgi:RimJ/RimL family protein N-acetyltransferase
MKNPAMHDETTNLKNGQPVRIRAIRPTDKAMVLEMFRNLEPESIYTRFFHAKKLLTDSDLKMITEVDFETVVALVVTIGPEGSETMIGGGRYVCLEPQGDCREAEVAFTVEEDYQGQGMAGMLLQRLITMGLAKGVKQFTAEVLAQNPAMLAVFSHSGLPVQKKREGETLHVTISLTGEET